MGNNACKKFGVTEGKKIDSEMVEQLWNAYDKDKSGTLQKREAERFLKDLSRAVVGRGPTNEQVQNAFDYCDVDKSGVLSQEQFFKLIDVYVTGSGGRLAITQSVKLRASEAADVQKPSSTQKTHNTSDDDYFTSGGDESSEYTTATSSDVDD
mmetsp:Transcript_20058/g.29824  ORF Transcript_20058/g.29824 Transcript_20058/m.29824 type:complete len:153 (+) Transcript_20058:28-486(+)